MMSSSIRIERIKFHHVFHKQVTLFITSVKHQNATTNQCHDQPMMTGTTLYKKLRLSRLVNLLEVQFIGKFRNVLILLEVFFR